MMEMKAQFYKAESYKGSDSGGKLIRIYGFMKVDVK